MKYLPIHIISIHINFYQNRFINEYLKKGWVNAKIWWTFVTFNDLWDHTYLTEMYAYSYNLLSKLIHKWRRKKNLTPPTSNHEAALESLCLLYMYSKIFNTLPTLIKLYLFSANEHANMKKTTFFNHGLINIFCFLHVCVLISRKKIHSIMQKIVYDRK